MRTRMISPDLLLDGELADLERATALPLRLTLATLPCFADREGRFDANVRRLKALVHPYDRDIDMEAILAALVRTGHVHLYQVDGKPYGFLVHFFAVQKPHVRESASLIPPPPDWEASPRQTQGEPKADQRQTDRNKASGVLDSESESESDTPTNPPPARETDRPWSEARLREHLPESCWEDLKTVLGESGRGAPAAARAIAAMTGLDPRLIPTGPGMQQCTPAEMGLVINRMATATHPSWHQTMANRCLEAVRREIDRPERASRNTRPAPARSQPLARTL